MDHANHASDAGSPPVTSGSGSASLHNEETQTRDEVKNTDAEPNPAEPNPAPISREAVMDQDPPEDPPQAEDTSTPVDLTGALEKQARRGDANDLPQPHSATDNTSGNEPRPPGGKPADSLFDNPPNLSRIRRLLFECNDPIEITQEEFETYWPFIDNVWVKQRSNASKEGLCTSDYYMCRLRRPTHRPSETRPPLPEGKRPRKKRSREGGTCNFQIKVVRFEGAYSAVTISRTPGSDSTHTHDLDYSDRVKRNSGVMEFVRRESVKGYLPSSIYAKFQEEPEKLREAGGRSLTVTDVRNVAAKWRIQNPEVQLVPHEGYEYQKGQGIIKSATANGINGTSQPQPQTQLPPQMQPTLPAPSPQLSPDTLAFPQFSLDFLEPYLPTLPTHHSEKSEFPHVTLSYASSMDSKISLRAGMQTVLSGPEAKVMTHYLRSRHDAILIGVGTVLADNPGLNCRLEGAGGFGGLGRMWQPRPVVIDPTGRWPIHPDDRMLRTAVEGKGRAPWVVVSPGAPINSDRLMMLKGYGGDFLRIVEYNRDWRLRWEAILRALASEGIKSVMIEGGGTVLNELLNPEYTNFIDSIIVTVAPTYLGHGGVGVSPESKLDPQGNPNAALNPRDVKWTPLGQNVIMCGKIRPQDLRAGAPS